MLTVKLHPVGRRTEAARQTAAPGNRSTTSTAAQEYSPATALNAKAASQSKAQDVVFVEPTYTPKTAKADESNAAKMSPAERAAVAASRFGAAAPPVEIPFSSTPANADIRPVAVNAAFMQGVVGPGQAPSTIQPGV